MELTGKQRAALRAMANGIPVVLYIGKEGMGENTVREAYDALEARELIKCAVQENAPMGAREACEALCARTGASPVQCVGKKFVIYRESREKRIQL